MATKKPQLRESMPVRRYQSPNIPLAAIRRFARKIADKFHPDKIILFGSFAYGKPHEDSDVDLLVVMPCPREVTQAIRIRVAVPAPFPLDLIVRTPKRLQRDLKDEDWFLRELVGAGKVLYEKKSHPVGSKGRERLACRAGDRRKNAAIP